MLFLSLPVEIRIPIYKELLAPFKADPVLIFHDREDRSGSIGIYPAILRTCRQVYAEAVSYLYDSDIHFEISLATDQKKFSSPLVGNEPRPYPDGLPWPRPFFKADTQEEAEEIAFDLEIPSEDSIQPISKQVSFRPRNYGDVDFGPDLGGFIHPHALKRIRHLDIALTYDSVWQLYEGRIYLSAVGELLACIFKALDVDLEMGPAVTRTLTILSPLDPQEADPIGTMFYNSRITGLSGKRLWQGDEQRIPPKIARIFEAQEAFRTAERVRKIERWACLSNRAIREASMHHYGEFQKKRVKRDAKQIRRGS